MSPKRHDDLLGSSLSAPVPRRKSKPKPDPLANFDQYLALKAAIANGTFKPMEEKWITITPKKKEELGMMWPWRTAAEHIRRFIRSVGLESDFHVVKYETDSPGTWIVKVRYEPPVAGKIAWAAEREAKKRAAGD